MVCSRLTILAVGTVAGLLLFSTEIRADVPEGPNQHCRDDAGPVWGDLEPPYFWNTPATPQLTNGACPVPLAAACADKGIKYAHLGSTPQCGGKGWFCRIMDQPGWENKFYEDRNFEHCNVTDADEKDQGGHCHGSDTDSVYGWWIRDHWHRGYPGTLHCCCDWEAVKGVVNRCDYRKPIKTATEQQQCRDANEEHTSGFDGLNLYDGNCAGYEKSHPFKEPAETNPDQCWTVTNFANPGSITKNTFNPPNYDDKQGKDFPISGPSPSGSSSNPTPAPPPTVSPSGLKNCATLGWNVVGDICAESNDGWTCNFGATYATAASTCAAVGARLCTIEELETGVSANTGCSMDTEYIWSSTWCGLGPKYYVGMGSGTGERKCKKYKKAKSIRCCSSVSVVSDAMTAVTTTTTYAPQVRKSCATLGWTVHFDGAVCGESDMGFKIKFGTDKCYNWISQPDGEKQCARLGGRLCTLAEITAGVAKSTGCAFDSKYVWTSTTCGVHNYVKANANGETECRSVDDNGPLKCCSDTVV
jgi:hypothetical protein